MIKKVDFYSVYAELLGWIDKKKSSLRASLFKVFSLVLLAIAGIMASMAYAPYDCLWLLVVALPTAYVVVIKSESLAMAAAGGYVFSYAYLCSNLTWVSNALDIDSSLAGLKSIAMVIMPMYLAIFPACALLMLYFNRNTHSIMRILIFSLAWVLFEYFRIMSSYGFAINLMGYAVASSDVLSQFASIVGVYGLSFLTVFLASMPAEIVLNFSWRRSFIWLSLMSCTMCALLVFGDYRLYHAPEGYDYNVKLRVVQGGIAPYRLWRTKYMQNVLVKRYIDLSLNEGYERITHFIWGEGTLPLTVDINLSNFLPLVRDFPSNSFLLTGSSRMDEKNPGLFNSWIAIENSTGKVLAYYDKIHLVPFGEFVPFREFLGGIRGIDYISGARDYSEGNAETNSISLSNTPDFHVVICYEAMFMGRMLMAIREATASDRDIKWILNITNDGWFGHSQGPYQHLAVSKIRAIESGLPMIRSANTGISAVYDGYGRLINHIPLGDSGIMDVYLPKASCYTLISKIYYYAAKAWVGVLGFILIVTIYPILRRVLNN